MFFKAIAGLAILLAFLIITSAFIIAGLEIFEWNQRQKENFDGKKAQNKNNDGNR